MARMPFCHICQMEHEPPVNCVTMRNGRLCFPGRSGRVYFTKIFEPDSWPTEAEMAEQIAHWDRVLSDDGTKQ